MQTKTHAYPQPEGILGDSMIRASQRIGDDAYGKKGRIGVTKMAHLFKCFSF